MREQQSTTRKSSVVVQMAGVAAKLTAELAQGETMLAKARIKAMSEVDLLGTSYEQPEKYLRNVCSNIKEKKLGGDYLYLSLAATSGLAAAVNARGRTREAKELHDAALIEVDAELRRLDRAHGRQFFKGSSAAAVVEETPPPAQEAPSPEETSEKPRPSSPAQKPKGKGGARHASW